MKVLLAEDDPLSEFRLHSLLDCWSFEVVSVQTGAEARDLLLGDDPPDIAILDWMLPGVSGVELCKQARRAALKHYVYILLLTGRSSPQGILQGWQAGADDYVLKPFDAHELRARLQAGKRIIGLQKELIAIREELRIRASHDQLTGLWSQTAVADILKMELARACREATPGALCLVQLERMQQVKDTWGYLAVDAILCQSAQRLFASLRPYDVVGRSKDERFLVVLPGCSAADAVATATRLTAVLSAPFEIAEGNPSVGIGVGLATWDGTQALQVSALLDTAEKALRQTAEEGLIRAVPAETGRVRETNLALPRA